jgi:anthranilate 1,2-dioxygenase small subunit
MQELLLWFELQRLQDRYIALIDDDRLEEWPDMFTEDGVYEIVPRENEDRGLPVGVMHCFGRAMLRDRVTALRKANIYEEHTYRHMTSALAVTPCGADEAKMTSNYLVVQTLTDGETRVYQAGRYVDQVVRTPAGWRYRRKRAIYDTSRVQTLLVTPI